MTVVINNQGRFDIGEVLEFVDIDESFASNDLDELMQTSAIRIVFGSCADGRFLLWVDNFGCGVTAAIFGLRVLLYRFSFLWL